MYSLPDYLVHVLLQPETKVGFETASCELMNDLCAEML